jgi:hypothetical protein
VNNYLMNPGGGVYPVCSFLTETCKQFRYDPGKQVKGHSILELENGILKVSTTISNLLPVDPAVSPGCLFYRCWINRVERDGTVSFFLPIGVLGVNASGFAETFGQVAPEQLVQGQCLVSNLNAITVTAEYREGGPGPDGKLILVGRIPKRRVNFY